MKFKSEGRKQDALKYGIRISNFPTHHYLEKDNMWRLTLAMRSGALNAAKVFGG